MKKCNLCNSTNLMESLKESRLIAGCKYVTCKSCGNVMILSNGVLIPTPQTNDKMTKAMIEDAAIAFSDNAQLMATSLTGKNYENDIQPTTVQDLMQDYVNKKYMESVEVEENFNCDLDCDNCEDGCPDFEEKKEEALKNGREICEEHITITVTDTTKPQKSVEVVNKHLTTDSELKDYLIVLESGEKQLFKGCSKQFLLNILNTMNSNDIELYELKSIKLKQEVKYNF